MKLDLHVLINVTKVILADKDLTSPMDEKLRCLYEDIGHLDNALVQNVTLNGDADIALAQDLMNLTKKTLKKIQKNV